MDFEWDENKNIANIAKHGYDFRRAAKILKGDDFVYEYHSSYMDEKRIVAIGLYESQHVAIIYTFRNDQTRIISVRRARKKEVENYGKAKRENR